ncbi:MAG TPA: glycosyltransferase family 61 protein [Tepidisphaeraceae bacterium]|nr:glycosyltransferase family 61 protein [Tepidisphaeraceae bacterium]
MGLFERITPRLYALVKRNRRLRNALMPVWQFSAKATTRTRSLLSREEVLPPPQSFAETTADWVAAVNAASPEGERRYTYLPLHDPVTVERTPPKTIDPEVHWKFRVHRTRTLPARFVALIEDGRVYGEGNVITPDDQLLADVSRTTAGGQFADTDKHPIFTKKLLPPLRKVKGNVAVLSALHGRGYYHWMFDVLPRLQLLTEAGFTGDSVDRYLVNNYVSRFHIETLNILGIPREKVLESHWNPHIRAEQLIVPSLVGDTGHIPAYACDFLRNTFLPKVSADVPDSPKRLYFNRGQVTHRKVTNEAAVVELLGRHGFKSITLEDLPLMEQIKLMANADVVVVPHGAGLTNIVFCKPGTKVIEFLSPVAVNVMYWTLCNQVGLEYHYLLAEGERPPEPIDPHQNHENMTINLAGLADLLKVAGVD